MVQLPEPVPPNSDAAALGCKTIADVGRLRIRTAGAAIACSPGAPGAGELPGISGESTLDSGFRCFKLATSNIKSWDTDFETLDQSLLSAVENIKPERSEDDVLYELLLKYGLDLAIPVDSRTVKGKKVYVIGSGALVVCLATGVNLDVVRGIAALKEELKPEVMRVVFRDAGFADDVVKTNTVQILKQAGIDHVKSL